MWAHQYLQQFNQIIAKQQDPFIWTHDMDDSTMFGLEPNYVSIKQHHWIGNSTQPLTDVIAMLHSQLPSRFPKIRHQHVHDNRQ